jgi:two-component system, NarL family, nitrate/nitrite response regulator NarL
MNRRLPASLVPLEARQPAARERGHGYGTASSADALARTFPLLIVDPQTLFRRGLALLLRQWYLTASIGDFSDIASALSEVSLRAKPEVVIADALSACRWSFAGLGQILSHFPGVPVVLLADEPDTHLARSAIRAGAKAFLAKSAGEDVLRRAITLAISGEIFLPREQLIDRDGVGMTADSAAIKADAPLKRLTYRQREVLLHLARGRSNKEIARCLGLLESTVKVHVKTILKKLAATNRTQAAMLAVEMGWARHIDA